MNIWDQELLKPQAEYPCLEFVRFVKRHPQFKRFLDIGCGSGGAHLDFLADHNLMAVGVDSSQAAWPDILGDIQDPDIWKKIAWVAAVIFRRALGGIFRRALGGHFERGGFGLFDCILDHNTLCHVERPPFDKIHEALSSGGIFFMVSPTEDTWRGTLEGKGFCRTASEVEIREMLKMFSHVWVGYSEYTDRNSGQQIKSYVVEAMK